MVDIIEGGPRPETLLGTEFEDWMVGYEEGVINGRAGNDEISAGEGSDRAIGGEGNDRMFGEDGWDHLSGDNGRYNPPMSGEDNDTFLFQFHNPVPGFDPSVGREPDNTTITDFDPTPGRALVVSAACHWPGRPGAGAACTA